MLNRMSSHGVRTVLAQSGGHSASFYAEAVGDAAYVHNRMRSLTIFGASPVHVFINRCSDAPESR